MRRTHPNFSGVAGLLAIAVALLLSACGGPEYPEAGLSPDTALPAVAEPGPDSDKFAASAPPAKAALVIGNTAYKYIQRLDNPGNDARLMHRSLKRMGFESDLRLDLTAEDSVNLLRDFLATSSAADVNIIYYAGHAVQVNGENYLVPVDFVPPTGGEVRDPTIGMIRVSELVSEIEKSGARRTIIILDACRNNPFDGELGGTSGLALPPAILTNRAQIFYLYSTAPGQVALDGTDGNSPFAKALAQWIVDYRRTFAEVVRATIRDVSSVTLGAQVPWSSSNFSTDLRLAPRETGPAWTNVAIFAEYAGEGNLIIQPDIWNLIDGNAADSRKDAEWKNVDDIRYIAVSEEGDRINMLTCQGIGSRCDHKLIAQDVVRRCEERSGEDCGLYAVILSGEVTRIWRGNVQRARGSRDRGAVIVVQLEWEKVGAVTGRIDYATDGYGELEMTMLTSGIRCQGIYSFERGNVGGKINGTCADGTSFSGTFTRNSELSYYVEGSDSARRRFNGVFALTDVSG